MSYSLRPKGGYIGFEDLGFRDVDLGRRVQGSGSKLLKKWLYGDFSRGVF